MAKSQSPKSSVRQPQPGIRTQQKWVSLTEDIFGFLNDDKGNTRMVKRFTWTNHCNISISVITYGARITSLKMPDRNGIIEELALGFDDLAAYVFYDKKHQLSGTVRRTTTKMCKSSCVLDGIRMYLDANNGEHHVGGGVKGLHQVIWESFMYKNVVQLSCASRDGEGGYPGDVFIQITFELLVTCEFKICITGKTSRTTILDITNFAYFNLAGHNAGATELKKHEMIINANYYTEMNENQEFATGAIKNVEHTRFNFLEPKLLKATKCNQTFCVNRGSNQNETFVARLKHSRKGRVLEMYTNQYCVHFCNGCNIPNPKCGSDDEITNLTLSPARYPRTGYEAIYMVISKMVEYSRKDLKLSHKNYFKFVHNMTKKIFSIYMDHDTTPAFDYCGRLKPTEYRFLYTLKTLFPFVTSGMPFEDIIPVINDMLDKHRNTRHGNFEVSMNEKIGRMINNEPSGGSKSIRKIPKDPMELLTKNHANNYNKPKCSPPMPVIYKDGKIIGRRGSIYEKFGGFCLRTQAFPSAMSVETFPKPILEPNKTYKHTITYKFLLLGKNADE